MTLKELYLANDNFNIRTRLVLVIYKGNNSKIIKGNINELNGYMKYKVCSFKDNSIILKP